jgi:hypothetical protein
MSQGQAQSRAEIFTSRAQHATETHQRIVGRLGRPRVNGERERRRPEKDHPHIVIVQEGKVERNLLAEILAEKSDEFG